MLTLRRIEVVPHHHTLPPSITYGENGWTSDVVTRSQSLLAVRAGEGGKVEAQYGPSFALGTMAMGLVEVRRGIEDIIPAPLANRTRVKALVNAAATESEDVCIVGKVEEQQIAKRKIVRELPFGIKAPFFNARYALAERMVRFRVIQKSFEKDFKI